MDINHLIHHPELLDRDTLYELRSLLALHPYYQTARLLMLQNLYLLHDPTFDEELRRSAIYIFNRKKLFDLVEGRKTGIAKQSNDQTTQRPSDQTRTIDLIDDFLQTLPKEKMQETEKKRKPTPADAAIDYVAYLLETQKQEEVTKRANDQTTNLIDNFLTKEKGQMHIPDSPNASAEQDPGEQNESPEFFTETLAKIYIRQGRYQKALEIIQQLNLNYPKKSAYFADQIRFLEKLIINNNKINS